MQVPANAAKRSKNSLHQPLKRSQLIELSENVYDTSHAFDS